MKRSKKEFKDENYIHILGWMINRLNLKGNELIVFAMIHGFSQDGVTYFDGSIEYISKAINSTERTVINVINSLVDYNFIEKLSKEHLGIVRNFYRQNIEFINQKRGEEFSCEKEKKGVKSFPKRGEEFSYNKDLYNNISLLKIKMSDIKISEDKLKLITPKFEIELPEKDIQCFRAAETFRKVFIKNLKNRNAPTRDQDNANYKNYVTQIRMMREVDKITDDQIALAYDYLNSDIPNFWQETIQSPSNLRKNITRVLIDCNKKMPKKGSN